MSGNVHIRSVSVKLAKFILWTCIERWFTPWVSLVIFHQVVVTLNFVKQCLVHGLIGRLSFYFWPILESLKVVKNGSYLQLFYWILIFKSWPFFFSHQPYWLAPAAAAQPNNRKSAPRYPCNHNGRVEEPEQLSITLDFNSADPVTFHSSRPASLHERPLSVASSINSVAPKQR